MPSNTLNSEAVTPVALKSLAYVKSAVTPAKPSKTLSSAGVAVIVPLGATANKAT